MSKDAPRYGIKLKTIRRYHYRGQLYERINKEGKAMEYAVPRELRDHLVGSGYFMDTLIDDDPQPIATSGAGDAPEPTEGPAPGKPGSKNGPPKLAVKQREPSAEAVVV